MRTSDERIEQEIAGPLRELNAAPDELHRARLVAAIEAALDSRQPAPGTQGRLARRPVLLAAVAVASLAAGWVILSRTHPPHLPASVPVPSLAAAPRGVAPPMLVPVYPTGAEGTGPALAPSTSLLAMAGQRVRATIATRVRLTLVGPGRVSVLPAARAGDLELALDGGLLLVDYDGRAGGTLRVRSPGAVTTIVGTLFAVDVTPFGSRVAVAHGRVRTQGTSGAIQQVAAGRAWSSADERVSPIPADLAGALRQHEIDWTEGIPPAPAVEPVRRTARVAHPTAALAGDEDLDACTRGPKRPCAADPWVRRAGRWRRSRRGTHPADSARWRCWTWRGWPWRTAIAARRGAHWPDCPQRFTTRR